MSEASLVFEQWIAQDAGLRNLLNGQLPAKTFEDHFNWKEHTLFSQFASYLSSYQSIIYKSFAGIEDEKSLVIVVSYLQLFDGDSQLFLEQKLTSNYFEKVQNLLNRSKSAASEAELLVIADAICNESSIQLVNSISRKSYPLKVQYIDGVLSMIHHPQCSARLAYRFIKELKKLSLNPEHRTTVEKIEDDLKSGRLLYDKKRTKVRFRSFTRPALLLAGIAGIAFGIYYLVEHQKTAVDDIEMASSFEDFSKEERIKIDSLIHTMQEQPTIEKNNDIFQWLGTGVVLSLRSPLENKRMEQLYNDWLLDAALIENGKIDTCISTKAKLYPGLTDASKMKGKYKVQLKNESKYEVFCFVFDDWAGGKIYQHLIGKGEIHAMQMSQFQKMIFVPGNDLSLFSPPKNCASEELPSKNFPLHFCSTDASLNLSLSTIYSFELPASSNKLMLVGDSITPFSVIDLYGILETN